MRVLPWGVQYDGLLCSIWSFMDPGSIYLVALTFLTVSPLSTWLQFMGRWRQGGAHTQGLKAQTQKRCLPLHLHSSWVHLVTWPCWIVQAIGIWSHAQPNSITWKKWEDGGEWLSMFTMPVPALPDSSTSHPSRWQLKKENILVHTGNCSAFAFRVKIRRACKNVF